MGLFTAETVLVTGGSRGIGAATVLLADAQGYRVALTYHRQSQAADALVKAILDRGGQAKAFAMEVASEASVRGVFDAVEDAMGPIWGLVNSAGITGRRCRLDEIETQTIQQVLEVNVLGTIWCCREAVVRMSTKHGGQGGSIVNVSSAAATLGSPNDYVWYAASKAAVDSFTLGLAREVALENIRVNAVAPGFIATDMSPPERLTKVVPTVPMQRAGTAQEIAESILFLLSERSSFTTGTILRIAGGR